MYEENLFNVKDIHNLKISIGKKLTTSFNSVWALYAEDRAINTEAFFIAKEIEELALKKGYLLTYERVLSKKGEEGFIRRAEFFAPINKACKEENNPISKEISLNTFAERIVAERSHTFWYRNLVYNTNINKIGIVISYNVSNDKNTTRFSVSILDNDGNMTGNSTWDEKSCILFRYKDKSYLLNKIKKNQVVKDYSKYGK